MSSALLADLAAAGRAPSSTATAGAERFSLLLLEDGEYYFRSHTACWWEDGKRWVGSLKVCSHSLFFVPRDVQQPIFRLPYQAITAVEALEEAAPAGGDQFEVAASTRVEMKAGGVDGPYAYRKGDFRARFSLLYACLEDALPLIEELLLLAHRAAAASGGSKAERAEVAAALAALIREHEECGAFNPGWLEEEESVVAEAPASAVSPLAAQPGRAVLTQHNIYFQPSSAGSVSAAPLQAYALTKVVAVAPRVYQLEDLGLEIFLSSRHSLYLAFRTHADRSAFQRRLLAQPAVQVEAMRSREAWTRDWVAGKISNFDYLMHLNREAGRSFKDLSQYPVMPWVVADYTSPTLDLSDPATYRDLSKPIGALNPRRLADFQQRFAELKQMMAPDGGGGGGGGGGKGKKGRGGGKAGGGARAAPPGAPPPLDTPPFLYGCHYSSPGYVVFYLMRSNPELMLRLQNGRFDAPDRLFWSIADTWKSVLSLPSDVKELVPEFYSNDPSFLLNQAGIDFGRRSNGQPVGDVALPRWASDARDFLYKLQEALESPLVSSRLHKWIDLVFGRKARGEAAEKADNVFHYLTYDEVALSWLEGEGDPGMRDALRLQMMEFGRTPRQLFKGKHPKRRVLGRAGLLACFNCVVPPAAPRPRPTNQLTGKPYDVRTIPPVSRAVFKLAAVRQPDKRAGLLQFLERAAAAGEPDALALKQTKGAELFPLVKAARDAREGRPGAVAPAEVMQEQLVRAVAALAVCPQNRRYILEAGCLDAVGEALGSSQPELATVAAQALALVVQEQSPRLQALDTALLGRLLGIVRAPPLPDALLAALTAVQHLSDRYPAHRAFFARRDLLGLLLQQLQSGRPQSACTSPVTAASSVADGGAPDSPGGPAARPGSRAELLAGQRAEARAMRRSTTQVGQRAGSQADTAWDGSPLPDVQPSLLRKQRLMAAASLLQDEAQREAFLGSSGALQGLLADCSGASLAVRSGAFECLASLVASDAMRQLVKDLRLLPLLLDGAACASAQVQRPAAEAIASLCSDPALVLESLGEEPGLGPVVALALSSDDKVQKSAAEGLWHLTAQPEARGRVVQAGALNALLSLATAPRKVAASDLARQALQRCCEGEGMRARLEELAAARGIDAGQLSALLAPSSARSYASSNLRKGARHRKLNSDVPSSASGAMSRSSSFRSAADASPAFSGRAGRASVDFCSLPSGSQSPMALAGAAPMAAAAAAGAGQQLSPLGPGPDPAAANGEAGRDADAAAAAAPNGAAAANGAGSAQKAPAALELPAELSLPLPLPIITPVGSQLDSPPPAAAKQQQQQQRPAAVPRLRASAAAEEAAASSPKGGVASRVREMERTQSGLGSGGRAERPS